MCVRGLSLLPNGLITLQSSFAVEKNRFFKGAGMLPIHYAFRKEFNHRGHGDERRE